MGYNLKPVYLYDMGMNLIKKFETTADFAKYSGYSVNYIIYNLKNYKRIRIEDQWFIIKREDVKKKIWKMTC